MRIGVRRVRQCPSVRRGTKKQLALAKRVAAGVPRTLIGGEVPDARCAGSGTIRERAETGADSAVKWRSWRSLSRLRHFHVVITISKQAISEWRGHRTR